jgi:Protein of unknown function (DUF3828)
MGLRRFFPAVALALVCFAPSQVAAKGLSPTALVANLYEAHNQKRGPFFQTRSKALLYQYFEKDLANLIWKDRVNAKGEVGVIDGDPLYDAQDMEIKNFSISKAKQDGTNASVDVNFENFGQKKTIAFLLVRGKTGWRIHDIVYGEGRTLRSEFKEAGQQPSG